MGLQNLSHACLFSTQDKQRVAFIPYKMGGRQYCHEEPAAQAPDRTGASSRNLFSCYFHPSFEGVGLWTANCIPKNGAWDNCSYSCLAKTTSVSVER